MRRSAVVAVVVAIGACTSSAGPTTITTTAAGTTSTAAIVGVDADGGLGDRLYPDLGNGGYDVTSYDIGLSYDPMPPRLAGTVTIEASALFPLRSFTLDLVGYQVDGVEVDGRPADHERSGRDLRITPSGPIPTGAAFEVEVAYHGVPAPVALAGLPFTTGWQTGDDGAVFLFSEPDGASGLFPANDHPSDRAQVTLRVSVPSGMTVVSGGEADDARADDDRVEFVFRLPPLAPYLVPLAIGSFSPVTTEDGMTTWLEEGLQLPAGFDRQSEIRSAMERDLGPIPAPLAGSLIVESPFPAALETHTLPTYTAVSARWGEPVIAHEIAHHWFGNTIAIGQWDDVWLNEGWATFMTWRWIEHDQGRAAYEAEVTRAWQDIFAAPDLPPPDHPPAHALFNQGVYLRGGLAIAQLRALVGDEAFFRFTRAYIGEFRDRTVTTEAFLTFVLVVLGPAAESLVVDWIRSETLPGL